MKYVGVFSQPISSIQKWIDRGINTFVSAETEGGSKTKLEWENAVIKTGSYFMDYPDLNRLSDEAKQPGRIAWMQDDEPDLNRGIADQRNIQSGPYVGWRKPEPFESIYQKCKSISSIPVFCNFAGPQVTPDAYTHGNGHARYLASCDIVAFDWYVKNKNYARYPVSLFQKAYSRLKQWSGGKPIWIFLECSDQAISSLGREPTAEEIQEQFDVAESLGAEGIIWFPQRPPPGFKFDAIRDEQLKTVVRISCSISGKTPPDFDKIEMLKRIESLEQSNKLLTERFDKLISLLKGI